MSDQEISREVEYEVQVYGWSQPYGTSLRWFADEELARSAMAILRGQGEKVRLVRETVIKEVIDTDE